MLVVRGVLAVALIVIGGVILVRMLEAGIRVEILPGVVLGAAMIALGVHRLSLILRVVRGRLSS